VQLGVGAFGHEAHMVLLMEEATLVRPLRLHGIVF
jgi:hypothetical protein